MEEDNREILRLLRDNSTQEKLEGLKRLIALSARPATEMNISNVSLLPSTSLSERTRAVRHKCIFARVATRIT